MKKILSLTAAMLVLASGALHAETDVATKTELQVAMQRHIDRSLIEGAVHYLDLKTGEQQSLFPVEAHPMILEGNGYYVLCSDLKSKTGEALPIDFYLTKTMRGYQVFRTEINNREPLKSLMKDGQIKKI